MKTRLSLLGMMLLVVVALSFPVKPATASGKVCDECQIQCGIDAQELHAQCIANGGSYPYCYDQYINAHRNCQTVFCVPLGCPINM